MRYRLAGTTWEELLAKLAALRYRAAIIGPHGRGKTTLLEDLSPRLMALGFAVRTITLNEAHPRLDGRDRALLRSLGPRDCLLLDGAESLSRLAWLRLRYQTRTAGGLVITAHSPGLLPILVACETTPGLLDGIVRDLLGCEAEGLRPTPEELFGRHRGNLRNALRELYDVYAGLRGCVPQGPGSAPGSLRR